MGKELEIQNDHIDRIVEKASLSQPNCHIVLTDCANNRTDGPSGRSDRDEPGTSRSYQITRMLLNGFRSCLAL